MCLLILYQSMDLDEKEFEMETYPALLGKTRDPRGHVTIYRNGKYIITGVDSVGKVDRVFENLKKALKNCGAL